MKDSKAISVIGLGVVGLVTAIGFAMKGHRVVGIDIDAEKVRKISDGVCPIYESALGEAMKTINIEASMDFEKALDTDISFLCGGTPGNSDGSISLRYVKGPARQLGEVLLGSTKRHTVVVRSTVVPGTTEKAIVPCFKDSPDVNVCVNPEFLREGSALEDFMHPTRIIIGENNKASGDELLSLYNGMKSPILRTNIKTAEMIKYASNSFLATKISFINEIGNICKKMGIDVYEVARGMGHDERIGAEFLRAGIGYGGFCLPKDTAALAAEARALGNNPEILEGVISTNNKQPLKMLELLRKHVPNLGGKTIGILGLAFKPETDDVRESKAIPIIEGILLSGARVKAHDPRAVPNFRKLFPQIEYTGAKEVLDSDAALIITEWDEYNYLNYKGKVVIDGRRISKAMEAKYYEGICW